MSITLLSFEHARLALPTANLLKSSYAHDILLKGWCLLGTYIEVEITLYYPYAQYQ